MTANHIDTLTATITKTDALLKAATYNLRNEGGGDVFDSSTTADLLWQASDNLREMREDVDHLFAAYGNAKTIAPAKGSQRSADDQIEETLMTSQSVVRALMQDFQSEGDQYLRVGVVAGLLAQLDDNIEKIVELRNRRV